MKNHQNAPKKSHHQKTCVAHSHLEQDAESKATMDPKSKVAKK